MVRTVVVVVGRIVVVVVGAAVVVVAGVGLGASVVAVVGFEAGGAVLLVVDDDSSGAVVGAVLGVGDGTVEDVEVGAETGEGLLGAGSAGAAGSAVLVVPELARFPPEAVRVRVGALSGVSSGARESGNVVPVAAGEVGSGADVVVAVATSGFSAFCAIQGSE